MAAAPAIKAIADITRHHAAVRPEAPAMIFEGRATSYRQLDRQASRIANGLIAEGI